MGKDNKLVGLILGLYISPFFNRKFVSMLAECVTKYFMESKEDQESDNDEVEESINVSSNYQN